MSTSNCCQDYPNCKCINALPLMLVSHDNTDVKHLAQMLAMEKQTPVIITEPRGLVKNLQDSANNAAEAVKLFADVTKKILPEKRGTNLTPKKKKRK